MKKLNIMSLLLMVLLFAVNCDDENKQSLRDDPKQPTVGGGTGDEGADDDGGDDSVANVGGLDTLCLYVVRVLTNGDCRKGCVLRDSAQFAAFLDVTGYINRNKGFGLEYEMAHEPDFEKWIYLGFAGSDWRIMGDIIEGEDTVTIGYTTFRALSCEEQEELYPTHSCIAFSSIPPHVYIYYIPFTQKTVVFSETIDIYDVYGK